jgi:hypothetical protein
MTNRTTLILTAGTVAQFRLSGQLSQVEATATLPLQIAPVVESRAYRSKGGNYA